MTDKGETKIITIITICIMLISIGLSGCIRNREDKVVEDIPEAEIGDLNMTIASENSIYFMDNKHINISIKITNIASYSVKIYEWYIEYIQIQIESPNNQSYIADHSYFFINLSHPPNKIELKSKEYVVDNMDIKNSHISQINWNITGIYLLQGNYDNIVKSNIISINNTNN